MRSRIAAAAPDVTHAHVTNVANAQHTGSTCAGGSFDGGKDRISLSDRPDQLPRGTGSPSGSAGLFVSRGFRGQCEWTDDGHATLRRLFREGYSDGEIADIMGRTRQAIADRRQRLGMYRMPQRGSTSRAEPKDRVGVNAAAGEPILGEPPERCPLSLPNRRGHDMARLCVDDATAERLMLAVMDMRGIRHG